MFPHEARLRNLTYNSPLYCDISCKTYEADVGDRSQEEGVEAEEERENPKEFLGWVPIMLRSSFCVLVSYMSYLFGLCCTTRYLLCWRLSVFVVFFGCFGWCFFLYIFNVFFSAYPVLWWYIRKV